MLNDPHPSQSHAGLHHAVWRPQLEASRPKARFKSTVTAKKVFQFWSLKVLVKASPPDIAFPLLRNSTRESGHWFRQPRQRPIPLTGSQTKTWVNVMNKVKSSIAILQSNKTDCLLHSHVNDTQKFVCDTKSRCLFSKFVLMRPKMSFESSYFKLFS